MSSAPRIAMLAGPSESSRMMYHALAPVCDVKRVIMERKPSRWRMTRRRIRRLGPVKVAGQLLFIAYYRGLRKASKSRRRELMLRHQLSDAPIPEALLTRVDTVNDPHVGDLLQSLDVQAVVVNGTRIIHSPILRSVKVPFLNTHMGITPKYRGVHGGYWALAQNDPDHCGVTVHLVDEGIDTGDVLYQERIQPEPQDNFATYPLLQLAAAVPLMHSALDDVVKGTLSSLAGPGPSRLWSHPSLWEYLQKRAQGVK